MVRTTAMLTTSGGDLAGGGVPNHTPAQRVTVLQMNARPTALAGAHAEITVLKTAISLGLKPRELEATGPICGACQSFIKQTGGGLVGPTTARWPWWSQLARSLSWRHSATVEQKLVTVAPGGEGRRHDGPLLRFDRSQLAASLDRLPGSLRTAFACACAQRLMPYYEAYCRAHAGASGEEWAVVHALDRVWNDLNSARIPKADLDPLAESLLGLIPMGEEPWSAGQAVEDAAVAVAYAIQSWSTGDSQGASWSAATVYDLLDSLAINSLSDEPILITPEIEELVLASDGIQRELARQENDLERLQKAASQPGDASRAIEQLRRDATASPALPPT